MSAADQGLLRLISRWYIAPGCEQAAYAALAQLAADVAANEPDTVIYLVHLPLANTVLQSLPPPDPNEVVFFEAYVNPQAFENHVKGPIFQTFLATYGALFVPTSAGGPFMTCEFFQPFAGFIRSVT